MSSRRSSIRSYRWQTAWRSDLESGIEVLDAGCGLGRALQAMAARYPRSRFTGYDLCADAIAGACHMPSEENGLSNIRFAVRDLTDFDESRPV